MSTERIATAVEIAADVRAGRRTAVDVVEDSLERIARLNGTLNAFCEVRPAAARAAAAAIDARVAAGEDPGPLAGVPIGVGRRLGGGHRDDRRVARAARL